MTRKVRRWSPQEDPEFADYVAGERQGGPRTRQVFSLTTIAFAAIAFLVSGYAFIVTGAGTLWAFWSAVALGLTLAIPWFFPVFKKELSQGKFIPVGTWIPADKNSRSPDSARTIPIEVATQVIARHVVHGNPNVYLLGLRNGEEFAVTEQQAVPTYSLQDLFATWRVGEKAFHEKIQDGSYFANLYVLCGTLWDHSVKTKEKSIPVAEIRDWLPDLFFRDNPSDLVKAAMSCGIIKYSNRRNTEIELTPAGGVWTASVGRQHGDELIDEALDYRMTNINVNGTYVNGDNFGNMEIRTEVSTGGDAISEPLEIIIELIRILQAPSNRNLLPESDLHEIDDSIEVLQEVQSAEEVSTPKVRQALRAVSRTARTVIEGAAGNGFYQALCELVS